MDTDAQLAFGQDALKIIRAEAGQIAARIRRIAEANRGKEAQFILECDPILSEFAGRLHLKWEPLGERRVACPEGADRGIGFIDRLFNRVVVEYESPGSLRPNNDASANLRAIKQVKDYMDGLVKGEGWRSPSVAGVATDGLYFIFCRYSAGHWVQEAPVVTDESSVGRFLRLLLTFYRPPLVPEVLVKKFVADPYRVTIPTVRAFYAALGKPSSPLTRALYTQWQEFFADIAGLDPDKLKDKKELMKFARRVVGKEAVDPARMLFALYTYSALLVKLLVVAAVAPFFDPDNPDRLSDWATVEDNSLRDRLGSVEDGRFFQSIVRNFTEGDFFRWYVDEWTPGVALQVRKLLEDLSELDPDAVEQAPERVRDLLKRLYHGLFPREVRHDLGEYYTPDWLAEMVLARVDSDLFGPITGSPDKRHEQAVRVAPRLTTTRFLDPACGSGTFLVLTIRRLRQWAREAGVPEREQLLPALVKNVMGFDLNPLAVISSRANFLLSVADLLKPGDEPFELPVYLADSIVLPAGPTDGDGNGQLKLTVTPEGVYELPLRGVGRKFLVPSALASRELLGILADQLRRDVTAEIPVQAFLRSCEAKFALPAQQWQRCESTLGEVYETLSQLHRDGRNGLWADIACNMFMPLFEGGFDFVVGNPPWVNWQSLPQHYRERSHDLWVKYGLFVHGGMDTILGKGKKELSALFTYRCADIYLKPGGKLGFVITQAVFKTTGAGQGFRRFRLGEGKRLRVITVDDFSCFQPFEEATNRTAIIVLQKDQPTVFPMRSYRLWRKKGRQAVPFTATLDEASPLLTYRQLSAEPIDAQDPTSAWLTAKPPVLKALRKLLGKSAYQAYAGAYSGGANAVYWLHLVRENDDGTVRVRNITKRAKREIETKTADIEPDRLYPLLRGLEVKKWSVHPDQRARFLIVQDPQRRRGLAEAELGKTPRTLAYLKQHEALLRTRAAYKRYFKDSDPFYSMFNIADHTFAPHKVVWAEQGDFGCAVVSSLGDHPVVPDHKIMLIPFEDEEEAHYVCAMANSSPFAAAVGAYAINIQQDPHILDNLRIPKFDARSAVCRKLSELSREAHAIASGACFGTLYEIEDAVDDSARDIWGLTQAELSAVKGSLADAR